MVHLLGRFITRDGDFRRTNLIESRRSWEQLPWTMGNAPSVRQVWADILKQPLSIADERRAHRISELLAKAILIDSSRQAVGSASAQVDSRSRVQAPKTSAARVAEYLSLAGEASPSAIRSALGLSRWSAYQALSRLLRNGDIASNGRTRALVYHLTHAAPPDLGRN